jgi:hypothetical protein
MGHEFCRRMLAMARENARRHGVKLPAMYVESARTVAGARYHWVKLERGRGVLREGVACCRWMARARAIEQLAQAQENWNALPEEGWAEGHFPVGS